MPSSRPIKKDSAACIEPEGLFLYSQRPPEEDSLQSGSPFPTLFLAIQI